MAMKELVIDISADGKAEAMHFDEFDLGFLGKKKISRASEIFYNEDSELWDIILPGEDHPSTIWSMGFKGYDEARNFEVSWLQECRKQRVDPRSEGGIKIAREIRKPAN